MATQPQLTASRTPVHARRRAPAAPLLLFVGTALWACSEEPTAPTVELPLIAAHAEHTGTTGRSFALDMTQEIANTIPPGDPNGIGTAKLTLNAGRRMICWSLTATNIALPATASHIHNAPAGVAGPIVLRLTPPDESGSSSGCAENVDRALIRDILRDAESYYVNVHTTEHPSGAIRAQLR